MSDQAKLEAAVGHVVKVLDELQESGVRFSLLATIELEYAKEMLGMVPADDEPSGAEQP
jgi:hypothetical protein